MEFLGIKFAPLNIPMRRRFQTLAAGLWFSVLAFGGFAGIIFEIYLILYTRYWWLAILYAIWIYIDREICEKGGRVVNCVKSWLWWHYLRDYFPISLKKVSGCELDPNRNYLFAYFPHGMLAAGAFNAFHSNASEFKDLFPNHKPRTCTLTQHYMMPFFREFALSLGGIAPTAKSMTWVLNQPKGGWIVCLIPGGAAEAYYCQPKKYKILVQKRKGFIKIALKCGSPLVPVIAFGEPDLFSQLDGPLLRRIQEFLRKFIGMAPVVPMGRGFLQYSFGIVPLRRPITTVVGKPIDVIKTAEPTNEQVEELHARFTKALVQLFDTEKHKYLEDAENIHIEL